MNTFGRIVLLLGFEVFPFVCASAATAKSLVVQRTDGCVVMDAGQAQVEGHRSTFGFELTHPGEYIVLVITRIEDSTGNPSATFEVQPCVPCTHLTGSWPRLRPAILICG